MSGHHVDRSLLLEHDEETITPRPIMSVKDADWRVQRVVMQAGYNSVVEFAVDELLRMYRDCVARVEVLEVELRALKGLAAGGGLTPSDRP